MRVMDGFELRGRVRTIIPLATLFSHLTTTHSRPPTTITENAGTSSRS